MKIENCKLRISGEHDKLFSCCCFDIQNNFCTQHVLLMLRASEKDIPVINYLFRNSGVVLRPGPHSAAPAAFFTSSLPEVEVEATGSSHRGHGGRNIPKQRKLKVNFKSDHLLWSALSRSELALVASIRQWEGNSGTLLSLSSGSQRYVKT